MGRQRTQFHVTSAESASSVRRLLHCMSESGLFGVVEGVDGVAFPTLSATATGLVAIHQAMTMKLKQFNLQGLPTRLHPRSALAVVSRRGTIFKYYYAFSCRLKPSIFLK